MSDTQLRIYEFGPFRVDALRRLLLREVQARLEPPSAEHVHFLHLLTRELHLKPHT
jgi:hypothetical protein